MFPWLQSVAIHSQLEGGCNEGGMGVDDRVNIAGICVSDWKGGGAIGVSDWGVCKWGGGGAN